ncbi:molybdate ABC transporter permease subunit [Vallitalea pronyensis]|uniref:Molybdenum transport system permease n=1 Tax=Vallitalea pronyensis TaxID=1348613 RepID=A0A8J8SHG8_9FIRM|nr:ABC transporter permease [Vallitalea pronyensis]QUI23561.1 molybdate ABC transporter permease subunit [Vallitalea pronyensis]
MNRRKGLLIISYLVAVCLIFIPMLAFVKLDFIRLFRNMEWDFILSAIGVSAWCSFIALIIIFILGLPTAYVMARYTFPFKRYMDMLISIPLVLPPAVTGLMLLMTFGRNGVIGRLLASIGINMTFSKTAVIMIYIFVGLPIFINTVSEGFLKVDKGLEVTALTLGDSPLKVFYKITYPLAKGSIGTGLIMAWARGIGEFGATIMFAGNIKGVTQTLPLAIYTAMESDIQVALFLSLMMILLSLFIIIITRKRR